MKKLEQIILLATCLAIMMMAAMMRDSRVWGHTPSDGAQATDNTQAQADVMRQTADGTLIVNTTAIGKDIVGYGGPVPVEIAIKDNRVVSVKALPNTETPDFFAQASRLIDSWNGKTVDEAVTMKVDAVSGATFSSRAIIDNVRAGLPQEVAPLCAIAIGYPDGKVTPKDKWDEDNVSYDAYDE